MKKLILAIILNLSVSFSVSAETSLWKVQFHTHTTYIGGTCHVLRQSDYPLPEEFERAYADSDVIVFETEIDKLNSPEIQKIITANGIYKDDLSLDKVLSNKTYDLLRRYCEALGIPVSALNRLKPPMVVLTLLALELQRLGVNQTGVDIYFHNKATNEGKKVKWLESVNEQMEFVLSMGQGNENDFIEHSIKDLKKTKKITDELIVAWKQGNDEKLHKLFVTQMKNDYPDLYNTLLVERNRQWLPKIERYVQDSPKEFVLIGVGHLVGEEGIIQCLKRQGYRINKLD